jgi:hypothetical protein
MTINDPTPESPLTRSDVKASITPNKVIENPDTRRHWQDALNAVLLVAAVASLFFATFPEVAMGTDYPNRIILFVNTAVLLVASVYGFTVTRPNIPKF